MADAAGVSGAPAPTDGANKRGRSTTTAVQAIASASLLAGIPPASHASSTSPDRRRGAASVWSSPGSHGVLDEEGDVPPWRAGTGAAADPLLDGGDGPDPAAAWGAAAEAAVADLADPSKAPAGLAALASDPHAPADIVDSATAWAGLMAALPSVLGRSDTACAAAGLVTEVAAAAAAEAPGLLPHLVAAAVRGLGGEAGTSAPPPSATQCVADLLSSTLPHAWTALRPPELAVAAAAVAAAVRREEAGAASPALAALVAATTDPSWLRRWGATARVAGPLWAAVGPDQLALHVAALGAGGEADPTRRLSAVVVGAALTSAAGRAAFGDGPPAAATALARLATAAKDPAAAAAGDALVCLAGGPAVLLPPPALELLVRRAVGGAETPCLAPTFAALARTPAGADALLQAVDGMGERVDAPWPAGLPIKPLPAALAAALANDALGALRCAPTPTPGALAAAAASRAGPAGLTALARVGGVEAASLADAWLSGEAGWVPPPPPPCVSCPAWRVCAAAAALAALCPPAIVAAVAAAIDGVPPAFTPPAVPPPPPVDAVATLHAAHGGAIARLLL